MRLLIRDGGSQDFGKVALSGKVQAAYDLVGYRHLRVGFPRSAYTADVEFREVGNESNTVTRPVEVTPSGQTTKWPGPFFGFRPGFRV